MCLLRKKAFFFQKKILLHNYNVITTLKEFNIDTNISQLDGTVDLRKNIFYAHLKDKYILPLEDKFEGKVFAIYSLHLSSTYLL